MFPIIYINIIKEMVIQSFASDLSSDNRSQSCRPWLHLDETSLTQRRSSGM